MGCNICLSNRQKCVEEEFLYPINNINSENDFINKENIIKDEKENKDLDNINDNCIAKGKNKEFSTNQIIPIAPKENEEINYQNFDENKDENIDIEKNAELKKEIIQINNNKLEKEKDILYTKKNISTKSMISSVNKNDYNSRIFYLINQLRENPKKYSDIILSNMQYINKKVKIIADDTTGQNEEKMEIFFQKKVKIELFKGEIAFIEAAKFLYNLKPLNELKFNEEIKINKLPETEEQIKDDKIIIKNQLNEINRKYNISAFFKDNVKNPEIGLMLMIIGDYKNSQNKKRNAILNPDYKNIAINSKFIGDKFVSYFTFSK